MYIIDESEIVLYNSYKSDMSGPRIFIWVTLQRFLWCEEVPVKLILRDQQFHPISTVVRLMQVLLNNSNESKRHPHLNPSVGGAYSMKWRLEHVLSDSTMCQSLLQRKDMNNREAVSSSWSPHCSAKLVATCIRGFFTGFFIKLLIDIRRPAAHHPPDGRATI